MTAPQVDPALAEMMDAVFAEHGRDGDLWSRLDGLGLVRLTQAAGATIVGIGALIEKTFEGGREALQFLNVPIEALVQITSMDDGKIIFAE